MRPAKDICIYRVECDLPAIDEKNTWRTGEKKANVMLRQNQKYSYVEVIFVIFSPQSGLSYQRWQKKYNNNNKCDFNANIKILAVQHDEDNNITKLIKPLFGIEI